MSQIEIAPLPAEFFLRPVDVVAHELLGKVLLGPSGQGRIVEVEAYGGDEDPASHAFRGPTQRSEVMFRSGGVLYTYFIYGMYWCANVVTGEQGTGSAVLIRALAPLGDLTRMFANRKTAKTSRQLTSGPGKLCQALNINGQHNGQSLLRAGQPVQLGTCEADEEPIASGRIQASGRMGIRRGKELPWRFYLRGDPHVSAIQNEAQ